MHRHLGSDDDGHLLELRRQLLEARRELVRARLRASPHRSRRATSPRHRPSPMQGPAAPRAAGRRTRRSTCPSSGRASLSVGVTCPASDLDVAQTEPPVLSTADQRHATKTIDDGDRISRNSSSRFDETTRPRPPADTPASGRSPASERQRRASPRTPEIPSVLSIAAPRCASTRRSLLMRSADSAPSRISAQFGGRSLFRGSLRTGSPAPSFPARASSDRRSDTHRTPPACPCLRGSSRTGHPPRSARAATCCPNWDSCAGSHGHPTAPLSQQTQRPSCGQLLSRKLVEACRILSTFGQSPKPKVRPLSPTIPSLFPGLRLRDHVGHGFDDRAR